MKSIITEEKYRQALAIVVAFEKQAKLPRHLPLEGVKTGDKLTYLGGKMGNFTIGEVYEVLSVITADWASTVVIIRNNKGKEVNCAISRSWYRKPRWALLNNVSPSGIPSKD